MRSRARGLATAGALALAALAGPASAAPPPCLVEASVEPALAFAGQQVLYRVRILRRADVERVRWQRRPAFPELRAEWLPGRAEDSHVERAGARYAVSEERRALFPERPGRHRLPDFELACLAPGRPDLRLAVPALSLEVVEPPRWDRPPEWQGAVGPLHVQAAVDRASIALGESVRLSVLLRGRGNLWSLPAPFSEPGALAGAEVFRRRPELELQPGERLYLRRFFRLDVVPRAVGRLEIPALAIPYFDPEEGVYAFARTDPIPVSVAERGPGAQPAAGAGTSAADVAAPRSRLAPLAAGVFALLLAGVAWRAVERRRRLWQPVDDALEAALKETERGDIRRGASLLARALREALVLTTRRVDRDEARACLAALDRARFSAEGGAVDAARIAALVASLRR